MKIKIYSVAILSFAVLLSSVSAQDKAQKPPTKKKSSTVEKKDVFVKESKEKNGFEGVSPEIGVLVEYISLDHTTANELLGKFASTATDATEFRDNLDQLLDNGNAELVETFWLRAPSGQRAKTESVREEIYPSEYDPPEIPNTIGNIVIPSLENDKSPTPKIHRTSATPSAFECRNVGSTLEVDPVLSSDHKLIDLNLAPEIVTRLEDHYFTQKGFEDRAYGTEHIAMPTYYTMKDTTQLEVAPGKYNLLGIHTPHNDPDKRVIVLLRADLIAIK